MLAVSLTSFNSAKDHYLFIVNDLFTSGLTMKNQFCSPVFKAVKFVLSPNEFDSLLQDLIQSRLSRALRSVIELHFRSAAILVEITWIWDQPSTD